jgi:hypothetical protein
VFPLLPSDHRKKGGRSNYYNALTGSVRDHGPGGGQGLEPFFGCLAMLKSTTNQMPAFFMYLQIPMLLAVRG